MTGFYNDGKEPDAPPVAPTTTPRNPGKGVDTGFYGDGIEADRVATTDAAKSAKAAALSEENAKASEINAKASELATTDAREIVEDAIDDAVAVKASVDASVIVVANDRLAVQALKVQAEAAALAADISKSLSGQNATASGENRIAAQDSAIQAGDEHAGATFEANRAEDEADRSRTAADEAIAALAASDIDTRIPKAVATAANQILVSTGPSAIGALSSAALKALLAIQTSDVAGLSGVLDSKAPLASPTFTGTVSGITKAMVGLGSVDNTSDANKPVSVATQAALNLKANLSGATFTGPLGRDASFYLDVSGAWPVLNFDSNDYISYDRTNNLMYTSVGAKTVQRFAVADTTFYNRVLGNADATGNSGMATLTASLGEIEVKGNGTGAAMLAFHRPGSYGAYLGIDTDNQLKFGGWSASAVAHTILHTGNMGNLNNTSDANKPVSTATQTALNLKANVASAVFSEAISVSGTNQAYFKSSTGTNPTVIHRNDGANYYFLLSAAGAGITTTWNTLRPFTINVTTGVFSSANGQEFQGGTAIAGSLTVNSSPVWTQASLTNINQLANGPGFITGTGRAYARRSDGGDLNFYWSGQGGQPQWLWGGSDGTNMYVYNPSNFSVAWAGNAGAISGVGIGNLIRRSSAPGENAAWSRQLVVAGSDVTQDVWSSPLELREVNYVGAGSLDGAYSPGLLFHWGSVVAGGIKLHSDGIFRFQSQSTSLVYRSIAAGQIEANGSLRVMGNEPLYFGTYGRGLYAADVNGNYGNVNVCGAGLGGWQGYAINGSATFMANADTRGIYNATNGHWCVQWDSGGNALFPANVTAYSDERLKSNKRPIDNVSFRRAGMAAAAIIYERDGETRVGFGAQTLRKSNPEVVREADDLLGTLSVNYSDLVAVLAADANQQSAEIVALKSQLAALEARLITAGF